jgi:nucleotidyltransferase/DNA polymerase involved in DNA repair
MQDVLKTTGICATAGIGPNLFLAKVALDITAKHSRDFIGVLDEKEFKNSIWFHRPITDVWGFGKGIATRLEKMGINDLCGLAHANEKKIYKEFGINAEILIDHANGIEPCTIKDIHEYNTKHTSFSNSQILFSDYSFFLFHNFLSTVTIVSLCHPPCATISTSMISKPYCFPIPFEFQAHVMQIPPGFRIRAISFFWFAQ